MKHDHRLLTITAALAATLAAAGPLRAGNDTVDPRNRIEGAWNATVGFGPDFSYGLHIAYAPGRSPNEGSLSATSQVDFTAPYPCVTVQGAWERTGRRSFVSTESAFCFDGAPGNPVAQVDIQDSITLSEDGNSLSGTSHIHFYTYDLSEDETFDGDLSGTRVQP
jgi:hypothetical protein